MMDRDQAIRVAQANLIALQSLRVSELENALRQALVRIRELEDRKPSDQVKREAQA